MTKHNPENERIKRRYLRFLSEGKGRDEKSVDETGKAFNRFEEYTKFQSFKKFHHEKAIGFKKHLAKQCNKRTGKPLSGTTLHNILACLRSFFQWLSGQPGYKSRILYSDADYFNLSDKDRRVARTRREPKVPTLEQIRHVISMMPDKTEVDRRDRALVALTLLTGARDGAITSLKLKHVDLIEGSIYQDAREVKTKYSKTFRTHFLPVGEDISKIVVEWVTFLRKEKLWSNDDPLFPATLVKSGENRRFEAVGLDRKHWSTATPIRKIFQQAFENAGLPYFNPHSFRNTLAQLGEERCRTPEEFKAWSQNLGHEGVLTTFLSYGEVSSRRQSEIIKSFTEPRDLTSPCSHCQNPARHPH